MAPPSQETPVMVERYPTGCFSLMVPITYAASGEVIPLVMGKYAWTCTKSKVRGPTRVRTYKCLGVVQCTSCLKPSRPKVTPKTLTRDLAIPCSTCGGGLLYLGCSTNASQIDDPADPGLVRFIHDGDHASHSAIGVPEGTLPSSEKKDLQLLVKANCSTSVVALRAGRDLGDPASRRKPAPEIAPQLANINFLRRQRQSILRELADFYWFETYGGVYTTIDGSMS